MALEARSRGDLPSQNSRQQGLIDLQRDAGAGQPPGQVDKVVTDRFSKSLGELLAGTEVGDQFVATRPLHQGRQGPGSDQLGLELPDIALAQLFENVQVLGQQGGSPTLVATRRVSQPPTRRLQIKSKETDHSQGASGHARAHSPFG